MQRPFSQQLLDTGNEELIEGNTWNDTFWGVCKGKGENNLGKLLMEIRASMKRDQMTQRQRWEDLANQDHTQHGEKFASIENKRSNRPDLHAFILLDSLFPNNNDIIGGAAHDEIFLNISEYEIVQLTDEQITELIKCGVRYGEDCLCMYV